MENTFVAVPRSSSAPISSTLLQTRPLGSDSNNSNSSYCNNSVNNSCNNNNSHKSNTGNDRFFGVLCFLALRIRLVVVVVVVVAVLAVVANL